MFHRWRLVAALTAAVFSVNSLRGQTPPPATPRVESAAAQTGGPMFGAGVNSDSGVTGTIALDGDSEPSKPPSVLLKLTLFEIEEIESQSGEIEDRQRINDLAKLAATGMEEIRSTPGGPVQIWGTAELEKSIELMRRDAHVRIVAEPSLVTQSGRTASFQTGGQIPIPVPQENGALHVEYRDLGVKATATPTYSQGAFRVELHVESNDLTSTAPPVISSRRVQTTVEMKEGQSAIVGGLVQGEDRTAKTFVAAITPTLVAWTDPADPRAAKEYREHPPLASPAAAPQRKNAQDAANSRHEALRLIEELYPDSQVQIIPLRSTVIVRGAVAKREHASQIAEIVSQYFPGALNHLAVKNATPAFPPGPVFPAPILAPQPILPPAPSTTIPSASAYPPPSTAVRVPRPAQAPDSLRELRDEVKLLRRDVNRLIDLLEKNQPSHGKPEGANVEPHASESAGLTRERPFAIDAVPGGEATTQESSNLRFIFSSRSFAAFAEEKDLAETTARAAEELRDRLAQEWLGQPLPKWSSPCRIDVRTTGAAGGTTTYQFDGGDVAKLHMKLQGPKEKIPNLLAHEVMHTVLATHVGRPVPRWADEGIASTVESADHREKLAGLLQQSSAAKKLMPLRKLFGLTEYPQDSQSVSAVYAQGLSLVEFLVNRGGKHALTQFLKDALESDDWDAALQSHFNFATCEECEAAWRAAAGLNTTF
jgi:hypothetical protein